MASLSDKPISVATNPVNIRALPLFPKLKCSNFVGRKPSTRTLEALSLLNATIKEHFKRDPTGGTSTDLARNLTSSISFIGVELCTAWLTLDSLATSSFSSETRASSTCDSLPFTQNSAYRLFIQLSKSVQFTLTEGSQHFGTVHKQKNHFVTDFTQLVAQGHLSSTDYLLVHFYQV